MFGTCLAGVADAWQGVKSIGVLCLQVKKKKNIEPMFRALLESMRFNPRVSDCREALRLSREKLAAFYEKWACEGAFLQYFKGQWEDKIGDFSHD